MLKKLTSTTGIMAISLSIMLAVFLLKIKTLPPQIPLFYSRLEGDDQIADLFMIFLLPLFSFIIVLLNNLIVRTYFTDNQFVKQTTYYVNLSIISSILFVFLRIIFLVA